MTPFSPGSLRGSARRLPAAALPAPRPFHRQVGVHSAPALVWRPAPLPRRRGRAAPQLPLLQGGKDWIFFLLFFLLIFFLNMKFKKIIIFFQIWNSIFFLFLIWNWKKINFFYLKFNFFFFLIWNSIFFSLILYFKKIWIFLIWNSFFFFLIWNSKFF